jgi:glutathione reductase (NADPH)
MPQYDFDLFVIGAGSGGVRCARIAAGHGARVAIAEKGDFGGTCVNVGCVPKKLMTYVASYASHMEDAAGYGWSIGKRSLSWKTFIERKNEEIARLNGIYENILVKAGVKIYRGHAKILDEQTVRVGDYTVTAERIVIATGGRAEIPNIDGAKTYGITSDDVFFLKKQPKRLVIAGAGYIALEFAGIFRALGSEVHLVFRRSQILNDGFDQDVREFLQKELAKKKIFLHSEANISSIKKANNGLNVHLDTLETVECDKILFATGRFANTHGLGLDKLDIKLANDGAILVNEHDQTSIPSIYAIGDVTNRIALTPVALGEGHALADRLFGNKARHLSYVNVPSAVFSDPNVSCVGLTEVQARTLHPDDIDIYKTEFRGMRMILANRDERTFMKLVVQRSSDKVLGVHMVGQHAGEIIQGFATALIAGATKADFDGTIGIHPTAAEEFVTMRTKFTD